ncbi:hypothetical protein [uncultured Microbacterium sp.]|uniref:Uncharacterized protein n=1 Tax=uncultured Microbacterium sp. TaxID=191216 RepID=A0A1Y5P7G4_9MICO|nr:hypothetical protein [uncultured Microbacterium sp.]SBS74623.1 membrane hypothetical protein [uncultured Microbacterium sp.]
MRFLLSVVMLVVGAVLLIAGAIWGALARVWDSRREDPDPALARIFRVRDIVGLLLVVVAHLNWQWGRIDANEAVGQSLSGRLETLILLFFAVLLTLVVFVALARRGTRGEALALTTIPLSVLVSVLALFVALGWAFGGAEPPLPTALDAAWAGLQAWSASSGWGTAALVLVTVLSVVAGVVLVIALFTLLAALLWMVTGSMFRINDVHPMLGPILVLALSVWTLASGLARLLSGASSAFPLWVSWSLSVGGPAVVVALTAVQIVRLTRSGRGLRTLVHRAADDRLASAVHRSGRAIGRVLFGGGFRRT